MKKTRQVKLRPKTRRLAWGSVKTVPALGVNGNWLAGQGFKGGARVEITVMQIELFIKPHR